MKKSIGFECRTLSNLIKRKVDAINSDKDILGVTASQGRIIGFLVSHADEPVYQKDLEENFKCRRSTMTEMLKLLEQNGIIVRSPAAHDARLKTLELTDKGRLANSRIEETFDEVEKSMLEGVSPEEAEQFMEFVEKCKCNLLK